MAPTHFVKFAANPNPYLPGVLDISPDAFKDSKQQVHLVDVRNESEYYGDLGHIPGALLLPLNTLPEKLESIPKDRTVVFVCRSGARSGRAAAFTAESGHQSVFNLQGGMELWNDMGLEVEVRR